MDMMKLKQVGTKWLQTVRYSCMPYRFHIYGTPVPPTRTTRAPTSSAHHTYLTLTLTQVKSDPEPMALAAALEQAVAGALEVAYGSSHAAKGLPLLPTCGMPTMAAATATTATTATPSSPAHHAATATEVATGLAAAATSTTRSSGDASRAVLAEGVRALAELYAVLPQHDAAHLLLQRILYQINRLNHFW